MFAVLNYPSSRDSSSKTSRRYGHGKPEMYCQYCQRRFTKSYNLMVHERSHFEHDSLTCDVCGKNGFKSREHLKQHRSQHSPSYSYSSSPSSSSCSSPGSSSP